MKRITVWLASISGRQDVVLAVLMLVAVFMMIIPLPTTLVDLLIAINLTFAVLLLMISLYIREPLEFSAFPSVLLITTLYRLALTISTSRLILMNRDAGDIIYTFGNFAVGGNLAVGLIVFVIITVVQFIVITKGAERVAEVGARFSLDAMPGKQMSIDGDMRAGIIDANEARRLRNQVQKESQLYGAMDGAMKFVKGDAIASIIIIIINIFGGISIGVFMHGMSAGDAMSAYAILSVGDGLVTQIPALLISLTAGIIVTRVPGEQRRNLAADVSEQIGRQPMSLVLAGLVLMGFAFIPGFPAPYFLGLAALALGTGWMLQKKRKATGGESTSADGGDAGTQELAPGAEPLTVAVGKEILQKKPLSGCLDALRGKKFEELGILLPEVHIGQGGVSQRQFQVRIYESPVLTVEVPERMALADIGSPALPQAARNVPLPFGGLRLQWLDESVAATLEDAGLQVYRDENIIGHCIATVVDRYAPEFLGIQETHYLMGAMEGRYGELVSEAQRQLPIGRTAEVLQRLVEEGISIRDMRTILEALVEWAPKERDVIMLTEYVRLALKRHIVVRHRNPQGVISAWTLSQSLEEMVRESVRQTSSGTYSALSPDDNQRILESIRRMVETKPSEAAVLVTALDVRRFVRKIIERAMFRLPVLSFQEIGDEVELKVLGNIELLEARHDEFA